MTCLICNGTIQLGVCINCGSDEGARPVIEEFTDKDRKRWQIEEGPPLQSFRNSDSTAAGEISYHGGRFHSGEW